MEKTWTWPPDITEYLQRWVLELRSPAFLVVDSHGLVCDLGGHLERYGLVGIRVGDHAAGEAFFLEGLLPLDSPLEVLAHVQTAGGAFADIHLYRAPHGDCVVLLDATEEVADRTRIEQALRHAQEELRQAEKMEALGRLAGGVAHDFNNLLTVILGYSRNLCDALPSGELRYAADQISKSAERAAGMTRQLLSFSRRQARHVEVIDINVVVADLQQLLRRLIGEDIALTVALESPLPAVEADRGQIEQILVNLAANARDAMPRGGDLEIRTSQRELDPSFRPTHAAVPPPGGRCVCLTVADTGIGMDPQIKARAFEPFFTAKRSGHGTGLGLSIVSGIVVQSGGAIVLDSEPGRGTRLDILLPAVDRAPVNSHPAEGDEMPGGSETILVVDDEEGVRTLIRHILTSLGYSVLEAALPSSATALAQTHTTAIDLLVTDFIMPQMNGSELAARLRIHQPGLHVLYVSGYAEENVPVRGQDITPGVFLAKPFSPQTLARRVREALAH